MTRSEEENVVSLKCENNFKFKLCTGFCNKEWKKGYGNVIVRRISQRVDGTSSSDSIPFPGEVACKASVRRTFVLEPPPSMIREGLK